MCDGINCKEIHLPSLCREEMRHDSEKENKEQVPPAPCSKSVEEPSLHTCTHSSGCYLV